MNKAAQLVEQFKAILSKGEAVENESTEIKMASMKLDDGVTVIEAEVFEAGQPVSIKTEDEQLIALPVGEYTLEDGMMLVVVEEGMIDSIGEKQEEEPVVEEEVAASEGAASTPATPKKVIEAVTKESHFSKEMPESVLLAISEVVKSELETFKAEFKAEQEKVTELSKEEEVETIKHNPEATNLSKEKPAKGLINFLNNRK